jgi:CDP-diacylglycerol pyrophosphatase
MAAARKDIGGRATSASPWAGVIGLVALAWMATASAASRSDALWHVVHDLCVTDMKTARQPAPCLAVDLAQGYAVLKDMRGATQVLLVPTDRVTGIESPRLLAPGSPNYWRAAWSARSFFEARAGRSVPREDIGLAVNSVTGRSQNQLHIHVDCVCPDVILALRLNQRRIGARWSTLKVELAGNRYRVRRLEGADLGARDPFKLLAADPAARADMGAETLAVIGAVFPGGRPGFILLSDHADLAAGNNGASENLLDHDCAVLKQDGPAPAPASNSAAAP